MIFEDYVAEINTALLAVISLLLGLIAFGTRQFFRSFRSDFITFKDEIKGTLDIMWKAIHANTLRSTVNEARIKGKIDHDVRDDHKGGS